MRLFIAINFDPDTKEKLLDVQRRLKACASGNFTRPENLHLTVAFLGEVGEASDVKRAISDRFVQPVALEFDRVGTFRRDLYWVGVKTRGGRGSQATGRIASSRTSRWRGRFLCAPSRTSPSNPFPWPHGG